MHLLIIIQCDKYYDLGVYCGWEEGTVNLGKLSGEDTEVGS